MNVSRIRRPLRTGPSCGRRFAAVATASRSALLRRPFGHASRDLGAPRCPGDAERPARHETSGAFGVLARQAPGPSGWAAAAVPGASWSLRDLACLVKPGIVVSNTLSAAVAWLLCGGAHRTAGTWWLAGLAALVAGASAWNMVVERDVDARMRRTASRPVACGRLSPAAGALVAVLLGTGGLVVLAATAGWAAAAVGAVGALLYGAVYTPLKRRGPSSLAVGAVAGAMPFVVGATAAGRPFGPVALAGAAWLLAWQFPHFLAIGTLRRRDYACAGLRVCPVVVSPAGVRRTTRRAAVAVGVLSVVLPRAAALPWAWSVVVAVPGVVFAVATWWRCTRRPAQWAGPVFRDSLLALLGTQALAAVAAAMV